MPSQPDVWLEKRGKSEGIGTTEAGFVGKGRGSQPECASDGTTDAAGSENDEQNLGAGVC